MSRGHRGSDGLAEFAAAVAHCLRDLPDDERADIQADVRERLASMGAASYADAVAAHGQPADYAAELREAMGMAPRQQPSIGIRRIIMPLAIVAVLLVVGVVVAWRGSDDIDRHPLVFGSTMTSGAASSAGSVIVVQADPGVTATVGVQVTNTSDRPVRVESVRPFVAVRAVGDGLAWGRGSPPMWRPAIRVFPQAAANAVIMSNFDDPSGFDFRAFTIEPGASVVVQFRGAVEYCIDAPGQAIGDRIAFNIASTSQTMVIEGTELSYVFGDCS